MATATFLSNAPDLSVNDYCVLGLATCYLKSEGEFQEIQVVEPIPSAALEAILKGIPTSYRCACAKSLQDIFTDDSLQLPSEFPATAQFCESFSERLISAARTYKSRPIAQEHIPLGTMREDLNYSLDRKRVLNALNVVRTEDNVKQHSHTHRVL